jgi:hypothetical protein
MYISKHITTALIGILALGAGYLIIGQTHPSTSDGMRINTGSIAISQSGIETDSGKRLMTLAQSGTQWGMSPFGSGKPLTEEKKPEFKKPNTEWKTRTLSGITYVFGEGNPKEIKIDQAMFEKACNDPKKVEKLAEKGFCNAETGMPNIVTSNMEKTLLLAISHPNWQTLYEKCESNIRYSEINSINRPVYEFTFDRVFHTDLLNIENFLQVDTETGWKKLDLTNLYQLTYFLKRSLQYNGEITNPYGNCVDIYGQDIINLLDQVR